MNNPMAEILSSVQAPMSQTQFISLFEGNLIPLRACLPGLTWVLHDYFLTIEDEIRYIWPHEWNVGKFLYMWIRYYGIALLVFDVTQIHVFSIPGITNDNLCVAMDSIIRVVGAFSLWPIEIMMQLRIYAIYKCSIKIAMINFVLFMASIGVYSWILIHNALRRRAVIADAIRLPLPGCPSIHSGIEWAQWVPATAFEGVLFGWALYKTLKSSFGRWSSGTRISLYELILRDNLIYFLGIACILVFNNLMVVGVTKIPWFSYGPFHAAMEIITSRMLINLYKASMEEKKVEEMGVSTIAVFSTGGIMLSDTSSKGKEVETEASILEFDGAWQLERSQIERKIELQ